MRTDRPRVLAPNSLLVYQQCSDFQSSGALLRGRGGNLYPYLWMFQPHQQHKLPRHLIVRRNPPSMGERSLRLHPKPTATHGSTPKRLPWTPPSRWPSTCTTASPARLSVRPRSAFAGRATHVCTEVREQVAGAQCRGELNNDPQRTTADAAVNCEAVPGSHAQIAAQ